MFQTRFSLLFLGVFFIFTSFANAEQIIVASIGDGPVHKRFEIPSGLKGKVDFWRMIFTKYGENQLVFHHRQYPEIIYSVLDLTPYANTVWGKERSRKVNQFIEAEYARIRESLLYLANHEKPVTAFHRRIARLFSVVPGRATSNYRDAAEEDAIRYQRGVMERFRDGLKRSGRYLYAMEKIFEQEGLPIGLTRLPLVESSFDYTAYSSVGAAGIWQFMRATGKKYMVINSAVDERRDAITATRAAARYLNHAYSVLGSWPLAVTSYNHGITGVLRAATETGSKDIVRIIASYQGSSFGFASKNFYAEFLAALDIEQNSEKYFPHLKREEPWYFDEIRLGTAMTWRELRNSVGTHTDELLRLNPALMSAVTSGRAKIPSGVVVKVPLGYGRKLISIFGRSELMGSLADVVEIPQKDKHKTKVILSRTSNTAKATETTQKVANDISEKKVTYIVKSGDSLSKIAKENDSSVSKLLKLNPKIGKKIKPGQLLRVK